MTTSSVRIEVEDGHTRQCFTYKTGGSLDDLRNVDSMLWLAQTWINDLRALLAGQQPSLSALMDETRAG